MSVCRRENGVIALKGRCAVEEAEPLLQMLQATPMAPCDWTHCSHLHTAIVQVILATRPSLIGPCGDPYVEQWIAPNCK